MLNKILMNLEKMDLSDYKAFENEMVSLNQEDYDRIKRDNDNLKEELLFQENHTHGLYHSEKVYLMAYLLSKKLSIKEPYKTILLDAAMYHDCSRQNNGVDELHGLGSAKKIYMEMKEKHSFELSDIYNDEKNFIIFLVIMEAHSISFEKKCDEREKYKKCLVEISYDLNFDFSLDVNSEIFQNYIQIVKVLRDADALDRKRFGNTDPSSLKVKYLNFEESRKLVDFAQNINDLYFDLIKAECREIDESSIESKQCLHSISFDFFKINSVLDHGILCKNEMKKRGLYVPRNFLGGNLDMWISVVDIELANKTSKAYNTFIKNGISFLCNDVKLHNPENDRFKAIETGRPWNKSRYEDEKYVFGSIPPEKITEINIPIEFSTASLCGLSYIYNSLEIDIIKDRVNYFKNKTSTLGNEEIDLALKALIDQYELELTKYFNLPRRERNDYQLVSCLDSILIKINALIGVMITKYYVDRISLGNVDKITVMDALEYELSQNSSYEIASINQDNDFIKVSLKVKKEEKIKDY